MAVLDCSFYSKSRPGQVNFTAILPVEPPWGKSEYSRGPWPTVYALHGFTGNRLDWIRSFEIEELVTRRGWAVIMPDCENRFYIDNEETGEKFGTLVSEELLEVTRIMFPLSQKREDTAIMGISMGGFGAVRNGLKYSDTFGAIMSLSGALITDEVAEMKPDGGGTPIAPYGYYRNTFGEPSKLLGTDKDPKHLAKVCMEKADRPGIFLSCGTEDFLFGRNTDLHEHLEKLGYEHEWWVRGGVHDNNFWKQALPAAFDWWEQRRTKGETK